MFEQIWKPSVANGTERKEPFKQIVKRCNKSVDACCRVVLGCRLLRFSQKTRRIATYRGVGGAAIDRALKYDQRR